MMKYLVILVLALFAMAAAQGGRYGANRPSPVNVVDNNNPGNVNFVDNSNPGGVNFVDNNNPGNVHFVDNNNPGNVHFVDNTNPGNVHFVDNNNPGNVNVYNPPPGGEPVDISPVYVNRPGKQYSNPLFRGGSGRR
ncbi:transcription factor mef2A-like isoform X21 [Helicoverpa zea]|uniref:transcription factor mef2A-like isoform X21 n=1 Tax=Helicoverpa zea TaxID=7113 RepID=UPI001F55C262|nr:transcription factor mef2A-like isoform X21 [Helicoverpa zea]